MMDGHTIEAIHVSPEIPVSDFANAAWKRAQPIQIKRYWNSITAPASRHAEARLLWSDSALHARFICHQAEPLVISDQPQTGRKTMGLWDRDVCEIFLAPDPKEVERYFEFEAAPTGEWLDVAIRWSPKKRESDFAFTSHMMTSARIESNRITVAMQIPWNRLIHRPHKDERWRVNLFRCVGKDPDRGYLAWQPTNTPEPSFHRPQVFGTLVFT